MDNKTVTINPVSSEPAVSAYLHSKGRANGVPVSGTFEITGRCNFNCRMCYVHNADCNKMKQSELPAEWWINTGREAAEAGTIFLLITGGEPLLREDFPQIYTELSKMGFVISLNTNGFLLNGKIAELFKRFPPNRINVSLYGTSDDAYEKFTGTRGFSTVIKNVEAMRSMGIDVRFNCSITPDNCDDMENIFRLSRELGIHIKMTSYIYPQVRINGAHGENGSRLTAEKAAECRVGWSKLRYEPKEFASRATGMKNKIAEFEKCCDNSIPAYGVRCRAGSSSFWINKEGEMTPCGMLDKAFDVKSLGFNGAWDKVKKFTSEIVLPKKCANCKFRHFCNVCAAVCYTEAGSFSGVPEYVCRFTEETARITLIELERLEKNGY